MLAEDLPAPITKSGDILGYKVSRKCVVLAGYRYLSVNYRPNGNAQFVYDVDMPGVMVGVTINLK